MDYELRNTGDCTGYGIGAVAYPNQSQNWTMYDKKDGKVIWVDDQNVVVRAVEVYSEQTMIE